MGAIVSTKKQSLDGEEYPSAITAAQAKLRQAVIENRSPWCRLQRNNAFDNCMEQSCDTGDEDCQCPEWYPAGVSPWNLDENGTNSFKGDIEAPNIAWMDNKEISARELHQAAILIQKALRGYQERNLLKKEQKSAAKIQKTFRDWKRRKTEKELLSAAYIKTFSAQASETMTQFDPSQLNGDEDREQDLILPMIQLDPYDGNEQDEFLRQEVSLHSEEPIPGDITQAVEVPVAHSNHSSVHERLVLRNEQERRDGIPRPVREEYVKRDVGKNIEGRGSKEDYSTMRQELLVNRSDRFESVGTIPELNAKQLYSGMASMQPTWNRDSSLTSGRESRGSSNTNNTSLRSSNQEKIQENSESTLQPLPIKRSPSKSPRLRQTQQKSQASIKHYPKHNLSTHGDDEKSSRIGGLAIRTVPSPRDSRGISDALSGGDAENCLGGHNEEHPAMVASRTLKHSIRRATRSRGGSNPPSRESKSRGRGENNGSPCEDCFIQGANHVRLKARRIRMNEELTESYWSPDSAVVGYLDGRNRSSAQNHSPVNQISETASDGDKPFTPLLAPISEDELTTTSASDSTISESQPTAPAQVTTKTKTEVQEDDGQVDSLIQLLYEEISDEREEKEGSEERRGSEGEDRIIEEVLNSKQDVVFTPKLIERIRTAVIRQEIKKNGGPCHPTSSSSDDPYGPQSILIAPPDMKSLLKAAEFKGGAVSKLKHLTTAIRLDYYEFMNDVEQIHFYASQQVEAGLSNYSPRTVLFISSTVPKCNVLKSCVQPDVLVLEYDFQEDTLTDLLDKLKELLYSYRFGAKAKYIGFVCKGGPGYFYLMKKTPVTPAKLRSNPDMLTFWQSLGSHMSKLHPGKSIIHIMESNVAGNRQGEALLEDLESVLFSHQVKVKSPLELAPSGREMINLYFDANKHKMWKMIRYTKLRLYK